MKKSTIVVLVLVCIIATSCSQKIIQPANQHVPIESKDYSLLRDRLIRQNISNALYRDRALSNGLRVYSVFKTGDPDCIEVMVFFWDPADNDSEYEELWNFSIYPNDLITDISEGHTAAEAAEYYNEMLKRCGNPW